MAVKSQLQPVHKIRSESSFIVVVLASPIRSLEESSKYWENAVIDKNLKKFSKNKKNAKK